jgi:small-conductance mechanosensitive channel
MNSPWSTRLQELTELLDYKSIIDFLIVLSLGIVVALIVSSIISKAVANKASAHYTILIRRLLYYGLLLITLMVALPISPLNLAALGAVLTLAVGFATRAPLSNIINGLALVFEKPFVIGDEISINNNIGTVISIDLLSIRLLSKDNKMIRVPNEMIFSSKLDNLSKYKIRRLDIPIYLDTGQDLKEVEESLLNYAKRNNEILETPPPTLTLMEFHPGFVHIRFLVWLPNTNFDATKVVVHKYILSCLQKHGISFAKQVPITIQAT